MPTENEYKQMLQKARKDLDAALKQKDELDARIAALKQAIEGLITLSGETITQEQAENLVDAVMGMSGITNGVRRVLSKSSVPMTAPEIRDALAKKMEYKEMLERYANPLSVLHNTLARLVRQNEVIQTEDGFSLKAK